MATFKSLAKSEKNEHHKNIFNILAAHESETNETQDGYKEIALDAGELDQIKEELYSIVKDSNPEATQSATELRESLLSKLPQKINAAYRINEARAAMEKNPGIVQDGYYNTTSGIGTIIDPGLQTESFIPVSITPTEATSYYANGGVPQRVINKKAGCLSLDGVKFECNALAPDDLAKLEDYANESGFVQAYTDGITQALIFGGAAVYPCFKGDTPIMAQMGKRELLASLPEKDFIKYWVTADRWNCVFVPDYNITAQDYLYSKSLFIPLGGVRVNTQRMAMIRPVRLPFWGAIRQMGWSTSDFEGWIKDFESYEIMKMSLPIMAQQMSLMYHSMPADGLIVENGPDYAKQFFKENEKQMREWSMLHPKAINSVGDIKVIERTYTGFRDLINEARLALCAASSVPESILFAEKASGLASDNRDDVELKQSEAIRLLFNNVAPSFKNCIELLVYSCFGKNSEQAKHAREIKIAPDNGVILSDQDKAQLGQAFSTIAGQLVSIGAPMKTAIDIAQKFVPSAELDEENIKALGGNGEDFGIDANLWEALNAGRGDAPQFPATPGLGGY